MFLIAGQAADDCELDLLAGRCQFKGTETLAHCNGLLNFL